MANNSISQGLVHKVPEDIKKAIISSKIIDKWNDLTVLARNEWICWVISVKKEETRVNHIERLCNEINSGKRRPCCWPGCPHRK
jgi:uncharacterized protein YdeI (YjbR/CyaY-like superfamily)